MSGYRLDRLKFLVVDDNKHMRALIRTVLHAFGAKDITEAVDGADAFKELQHFDPDITICDCNMMPVDGLDFVRLVRTAKDSPNPFLPVIFLTGHTEMAKVIEARDAGVNEFLAKPISARALYARIKKVIETPRAFVRTKTYFGPCRRRKQSNWHGAERRKVADGESQNPGLSEAEVNRLLRGN